MVVFLIRSSRWCVILQNVTEKLIKERFKSYKKLHTAKYGCAFRDKLIGFVVDGKIAVEDVIEIFDTLNDLDTVRKRNHENVKGLLFSAIENNNYNSSVLDKLYKWEYLNK